MLQQKPCSRNVEIPGGRGGLQRPPWNGNSEGVGGCKPKTFRGRGMDIFWNHTITNVQRFLTNFFVEFLVELDVTSTGCVALRGVASASE